MHFAVAGKLGMLQHQHCAPPETYAIMGYKRLLLQLHCSYMLTVSRLQGREHFAAEVPVLYGAQVSFTLSDMVRSGTNLGQLLNTHALLVRLGRRSSPIFQHSAHKEAALLEYDGSYLAAAQEARATYFKCGDWRCASRFYCSDRHCAPLILHCQAH